jgi:hypothetical protein
VRFLSAGEGRSGRGERSDLRESPVQVSQELSNGISGARSDLDRSRDRAKGAFSDLDESRELLLREGDEMNLSKSNVDRFADSSDSNSQNLHDGQKALSEESVNLVE